MFPMIDNYDSFTYDPVQYFGELREDVRVVRNDAIDLAGIAAMAPVRIAISPEPCTPNNTEISMLLVRAFAGKLPSLGVCLGHQAIGHAFGGRIGHAALKGVQFHRESILAGHGHAAEKIFSSSATTWS